MSRQLLDGLPCSLVQTFMVFADFSSSFMYLTLSFQRVSQSCWYGCRLLCFLCVLVVFSTHYQTYTALMWHLLILSLSGVMMGAALQRHLTSNIFFLTTPQHFNTRVIVLFLIFFLSNSFFIAHYNL